MQCKVKLSKFLNKNVFFLWFFYSISIKTRFKCLILSPNVILTIPGSHKPVLGPFYACLRYCIV